jgi:hypothetical protein
VEAMGPENFKELEEETSEEDFVLTEFDIPVEIYFFE